MTKYQYAGLTPELHSRLVSERVALKEAHPRDYKQYFQDVKQCDELQARLTYQAFNNVVVGRWKMTPNTAERLEGIISDELFNDLKDYLSKNYKRGTVLCRVYRSNTAQGHSNGRLTVQRSIQ